MPPLPPPLHRFLFQPVSAAPFSIMRTAWAGLTFLVFLAQWQSMPLLYGGEVFPLYVLLLLALLSVLLGRHTRIALLLSFLLFTFFLRRNALPLGGGEFLLHHLGFLLMMTPEKDGTMPIWPYRLLLFQVVLLYVSSAWQKLLGGTWWDGTAIAIALQHPHFARWPALAIPVPPWFFPSLAWIIVSWELAWLMLLIPRNTSSFFGMSLPPIKRLLLLSGVVFHAVILLFLKVGSFSPAVLVAYLGLWYGGTPLEHAGGGETLWGRETGRGSRASWA